MLAGCTYYSSSGSAKIYIIFLFKSSFQKCNKSNYYEQGHITAKKQAYYFFSFFYSFKTCWLFTATNILCALARSSRCANIISAEILDSREFAYVSSAYVYIAKRGRSSYTISSLIHYIKWRTGFHGCVCVHHDMASAERRFSQELSGANYRFVGFWEHQHLAQYHTVYEMEFVLNMGISYCWFVVNAN